MAASRRRMAEYLRVRMHVGIHKREVSSLAVCGRSGLLVPTNLYRTTQYYCVMMILTPVRYNISPGYLVYFLQS